MNNVIKTAASSLVGVASIVGFAYAAENHVKGMLSTKADAASLHQYIQMQERRTLREMKREVFIIESKPEKTDLDLYILNELKTDIELIEQSLGS